MSFLQFFKAIPPVTNRGKLLQMVDELERIAVKSLADDSDTEVATLSEYLEAVTPARIQELCRRIKRELR